jgi:hypothetical protein
MLPGLSNINYKNFRCSVYTICNHVILKTIIVKGNTLKSAAQLSRYPPFPVAYLAEQFIVRPKKSITPLKRSLISKYQKEYQKF